MSLREEIKELLPDNVYDIKVDRGEVYGLPAINVVIYYTVGSPEREHKWFLDMNFSNKNQMNAPHIAAVLKSYMNGDDIGRWEGEGGNGNK